MHHAREWRKQFEQYKLFVINLSNKHCAIATPIKNLDWAISLLKKCKFWEHNGKEDESINYDESTGSTMDIWWNLNKKLILASLKSQSPHTNDENEEDFDMSPPPHTNNENEEKETSELKTVSNTIGNATNDNVPSDTNDTNNNDTLNETLAAIRSNDNTNEIVIRPTPPGPNEQQQESPTQPSTEKKKNNQDQSHDEMHVESENNGTVDASATANTSVDEASNVVSTGDNTRLAGVNAQSTGVNDQSTDVNAQAAHKRPPQNITNCADPDSTTVQISFSVSPVPNSVPIISGDDDGLKMGGTVYFYQQITDGKIDFSNKFVKIAQPTMKSAEYPFQVQSPLFNHTWDYNIDLKRYDHEAGRYNGIVGSDGTLSEARIGQYVYYRSSVDKPRRKYEIEDIQNTTADSQGAIWKLTEICSDGGKGKSVEAHSFNFSKLSQARM
ncbi:MAG: hypothetical protein ACPG2Y_00275 [Acholeplasmataceae bacterium]